jgi:membrane protein DedA with SNARE-associated domain
MATLLPYLEHFTYGAAFVLLLAAGIGIPIPEDVPLLLSGYLSHQGVMRMEVALPVCFAGVLLGDAALFFLARHGGSRLATRPLTGGVLTRDRMVRARGVLSRHGAKAIVIARHVAGLRVAVFAAAGAGGMPFRRFIFWDALSSCASVPLMLGLGYVFSDRLEVLTRHIHRVHHWAIAIALALAIGALLWWQIGGRVTRR